jgi:hypothetical protein
MKKVCYLELTLIVLSAASMNAQVTIGSLDNPHPGAVLDLHSNSLGFLLPTVSLNDVSDFQLAADTARATGMTVYNTNPAIGAGLYIWDGSQWNRVGAGISTGCSEVPEVPTGITLPATATVGGPFIASVPAVTGNNAPTSYNWHLPNGLTVMAGAGTREITIKATIAKTYPADSIKVTATNDCGTSAAQSNTAPLVVTQAVGPGEIVVGSNTYTTYCYPNGVGCWMTENSKEGSPIETQYPGRNYGERGYYYTWGQAFNACPSGWMLPNQAQWIALTTYMNGTATHTEKLDWLYGQALAGRLMNWGWDEWDWEGFWWCSFGLTSGYLVNAANSNVTQMWPPSEWDEVIVGASVRCIKE